MTRFGHFPFGRVLVSAIALAGGSFQTAAADPAPSPGANVTPYDWSHASPASERYRVTVNGQPVFVGDFWSEHFAQFEFTGRVEVEVTFLAGAIDPALTAVSPKSWEIPYTIAGDRLRFTIERPKQYVIRINEPLRPAVSLHYLFLFAEPPEVDPPEPGTPGVIDVVAAGIDATGATEVTAQLSRLIDEAPAGSVLHFPRGTYAIENLIVRRPATTLHFAPGAFLHAQLPGSRATRRRALSVLEAPGVTIRGRGLIEAHGYAVTIEKSPGLVIEDVMIRSDAIGKQGVTPAGNEDGGRGLILGHSDRYRLTNLKILTVMDQAIGKGKDGMNLASSSDALVERCFAIAGDDIYTIKGRHDSREWISVDLGGATPLARVTTRWGQSYFGRYLVESSNDEKTWTVLAEMANTTGEHTQTITVSGAGRFVRLRSQATTVNFHAGDLLRELEVYASNAAAAPNIALRRAVKTSPYGSPWPGGHDAAKAVDGEAATSWANDYRSRRVLFRDNIALVTANPIKIGTGADYAGEDITWENHDVIDAGFLNEEGFTGGGMMNFSHYNYDHTPHEMAMTGIRVRRARFEDVVGFLQVGWYFHRTNENYWFATCLEAEFDDITIDHVHPGMTLFQILLHPETGCARLKFTNLQIGGRMIRNLDDLTATGVTVDLRGVNNDDRIEFVVRP